LFLVDINPDQGCCPENQQSLRKERQQDLVRQDSHDGNGEKQEDDGDDLAGLLMSFLLADDDGTSRAVGCARTKYTIFFSARQRGRG